MLALLALNAGEVDAQDAVRPLVVSLLLALGAILVARPATGSRPKAAVLATLLILLVFSYGHVYALLRQDPVLGVVGRHRYLLGASLGLVGASVVALRRVPLAGWVGRFLNAAAATLVVLVSVQAAGPLGRGSEHADEAPAAAARPALVRPPEGAGRDVYYIVLDAYTRADVLESEFSHDNRPFLRSLEALGFVIADRSRSNYAVTRLSLPSSLNMDYAEALGPPLDPEATDAAWLDRVGRYGAVRTAFEDLGYRIVAFETAYGLTEWVDSDLYLTRSALALSDAQAFYELTPFEVLLVQTSMARLALDGRTWLNRTFRTEIKAPHEQHRERILFVFDRLERMPTIDGPKFVFVHLMAPHPPYAFTADGRPAPEADIFSLAADPAVEADLRGREGYRNQVVYLNTRLLQVVTAILEASPVEPIIILQGDHGALAVSREDRLKILNAYYLPAGGREAIYPTISPVNTFRVVFNHYFGADLPLLEDRSYYSPADRPFQLEAVP